MEQQALLRSPHSSADPVRFWVGTSWKMNKTLTEARDFADGLLASTVSDERIQQFVIPPFTVCREVKRLLRDVDVHVGAQNMHWAEQGPWTGEISAPMLKDCGLSMVELGHSERREHFGETDETVGLKVASALKHDLIPLICVGETLSDKESGRADAVLTREVQGALGALSGYRHTEIPILFAYEPVWAIGESGTPASAEYADARQKNIIAVAQDILGHRVPCLYGGSVNPQNCTDFVTCEHVDGLFIGRSAWNVAGYLDIVTRVSRTLDRHVISASK
jgi:L-erythrulose 1-phosphate isomerase